MTPKELLKEIKTRHESLYDRYYNTEKYHFNENNEFLYDDLENALNELERLKKFKETFDNYELVKKQDFIAYENWLECEAELKKSPTSEEVCKELSEYLKQDVKFSKITYEFFYEDWNIDDDFVDYHITEFYNNEAMLNMYLPPHLITLIGRFYEGLK